MSSFADKMSAAFTDAGLRPRAANRYQQLARRLELRTVSSRLAGHLFPACRDSGNPSGRYRFLEGPLEQSPALLRAVLDGDSSYIDRQWAKVLADHGGNSELLHGLAVLSWEQAEASLATGTLDAGLWTKSTLLLSLLFCSEDFLAEFSNHRFQSRLGEARTSIEEPQTQVQLALLRSLFSLHVSEAGKHYRQKRWDSARAHFRCLNHCSKGAQEMIAQLRELGVPFCLKVPDNQADRVKEIAATLLDDWSVGLVRDAIKAAEDPDAIKALPKGIRKNYRGAIQQLEPFVRLGIPIPRVLRCLLEHYNTWCRDLYQTEDIDQIRKLLEPAKKAADQLMPLCIKGRGHQPENQVLSEHWMLQGFASQRPDAGQAEYEQALEWNPANSNAEQLLGGAVQQVEDKQLDNAIACMEKKQYREAYEVLDGLEQRAKADTSRIREVRAIVCFRHADTLAEEGNFRDALSRAREAQRCNPDQPVIQQMVKQMEVMAPEQDNLKHLKAAEQAMKKNQYDAVIRSASQVSPRSKFISNARGMASAAHFHHGLDAYKRELYANALADLEKSLELNDNPEERKIISHQLEVVRQDQALQGLQAAMERQDWPEAERVLRRALAGKLPANLQRQIQTQLAGVLNVRAVQILNEYQASMSKFQRAIGEIIEQIKKLPGVR